MKIPMPIIIVFLSAWVSLQGFTLLSLYELHADVTTTRALLEQHIRESHVALGGVSKFLVNKDVH